jgi:hypothetical protein
MDVDAQMHTYIKALVRKKISLPVSPEGAVNDSAFLPSFGNMQNQESGLLPHQNYAPTCR